MSGSAPLDRLVTLPPGVPKLTLGYQVAKWSHKYLLQPNGVRAGQRFTPVDSQIRFWLWWYAVDDEGRWVFSRAIRRLAKGSGKSPFAGAQAMVELCGPCRLNLAVFDGTQASIDRPDGVRPVSMPLVQVVATSEQQTANTMRHVRMFSKNPRLRKDYGLDPGKEQVFIPPEGTLEQRTSSAATAEGAEATHVVADETEHWRPSNGGVELANTLLDNLAKSGSRMMETCNAWVPGVESVAEKSWDAWVAQEEGRIRDETGLILYDARLSPADIHLEDPEWLRQALDFVYDDCYWADREAIMRRIYDPSSSMSDSIRKYLNRPSSADDAWVKPEQWSTLSHPEIRVAPREPIAMFFDGSKSRDATGLVGCRMIDGHVFVIGCYEPDPAHDLEDTVPVEEVDGWVEKAFETYDVLGFFADVREWEQFTKLTWPERYADRLYVTAVSGKDPQPIAWDMRSHGRDFGLACETAEAEIVEKGFTHDGDSRLARHVANARRRPNRTGQVAIGKESASSSKKIDLAVCMVGARMVRRLVLATDKWERRTRIGQKPMALVLR